MQNGYRSVAKAYRSSGSFNLLPVVKVNIIGGLLGPSSISGSTLIVGNISGTSLGFGCFVFTGWTNSCSVFMDKLTTFPPLILFM